MKYEEFCKLKNNSRTVGINMYDSQLPIRPLPTPLHSAFSQERHYVKQCPHCCTLSSLTPVRAWSYLINSFTGSNHPRYMSIEEYRPWPAIQPYCKRTWLDNVNTHIRLYENICIQHMSIRDDKHKAGQLQLLFLFMQPNAYLIHCCLHDASQRRMSGTRRPWESRWGFYYVSE